MAADTEKFILPSGQEIEKEKETPPDMVLVKTRIEENIAALKNFNEKREDGKSRSEYMELLRNDLKFYYGYNDYLIERFTELFPIDQYVAFFEANEHPRKGLIVYFYSCSSYSLMSFIVSIYYASPLCTARSSRPTYLPVKC